MVLSLFPLRAGSGTTGHGVLNAFLQVGRVGFADPPDFAFLGALEMLTKQLHPSFVDQVSGLWKVPVLRRT